jgi:L-rhamnose isomerase/sugar isomerase
MDTTRTIETKIDPNLVAKTNARLAGDLEFDYAALGKQLARGGLDIERVTDAVARFGVAIPSWGVGTGGTRFGRFPGPGEPRHVMDKLEDCAVIHQLTGATPSVSLHFPWDEPEDPAALRARGESLGLGFAAVNSNTFQDQKEQKLSYKYGSLSHTDASVREQAVVHNLHCVALGTKLGADEITVWIGDGSNFAGQQHTTRAFERYLESLARIRDGMPKSWRMMIEHKIAEPAFYATVLQDWGSSLMAAQATGPQCMCLVDLGHHAPNVNIEMIVARLIQAGKLGGFHFNDSRYGDDDLDAGSINPFRLFLVFNELVDAEWRKVKGRRLSHMLDQSHNVTDPIESLMTSAVELQRAYAQALLVDRDKLDRLQTANDAMGASQELKRAFTRDVSPIMAMARSRKGAAIDPIAAYRESGYRAACAKNRPAQKNFGGGIV